MNSSPKRTKKHIFGWVLAALLIVIAGYGIFYTLHSHALDPNAKTVPILMYHSVTEDASKAGKFVVTGDEFKADMEYLKDKGYTTIFLSQLTDYVYDGSPLPDKPVIVTLDDGYLNNLTVVLPILQAFNMKATVSVVGRYTNDAGRDGTYGHLNWDEVQTLADSGNVEIASHTFAMHEKNSDGRKGCRKKSGESTAEYQAALTADLEKLQTQMADNCGIVLQSFTYPFGAISGDSVAVLKDLGFKAALTCRPGVNHITRDPERLYDLHRFNRPSGVSTELFMKLIK